MRLDAFLTDTYKKYTRSFLQKLIRAGGVTVNSTLATRPHILVKDTDHIVLNEKILEKISSKKTFSRYQAEVVLYESPYFLVISKPPFVTTEHVVGSLLPVHRLDKDTSGVLVIAKDVHTQAQLQKQWKQRTVKKEYLALIKGTISPPHGAIEGGIFRSISNRKKMAVSSLRKARAAYTEYKVVNVLNPFKGGTCTLVHIFPKTGRTHQIRVHFASIDYPVIGDNLYGDKNLNKKFEKKFGLTRQFLHAYSLSLEDPSSGKKRTFTSKIPHDLQRVLDQIH